MKRLTVKSPSGLIHPTNMSEHGWNSCIKKLSDYEDIELTPEELRKAFDIIAREDKKIKKVVEDLKYYLDTNEENGVVYIPKFVVEKIVNDK